MDGAAKTLVGVWSGGEEDEREKQFLIAVEFIHNAYIAVPS